MARAGAGPPRELSLEEVLKCYEQPLNEEQAWALCFQGCRAAAAAPVAPAPLRTADIRLRADGSVRLPAPPHDLPALLTPSAEAQMVQSLGFAVYRALDWGLDENEERELSPRLEQLIDLMTNSDSEDSGCATADEGYGGQDEEEEGGEGPPRSVRTFGQAMRCCAARLADPAGAPAHYQAVCRALFAETVELMAFLAKIRDAKELLQKLKEDEEEEERPAAELGNLRNTDWARLWVQLMRELRHGVKLKKVQEKQFNPLPTEYQLTPFEMLMQDIRARNYKLRKVMVDGDIPPRVKKDAHELILDFIRSRPPLKQASERRLRPLPQKQRTLHEKILEEIRQERKLRPVEQKGSVPASCHPLPDGPALPRAALGAVEERPEDGSSAAPASSSKHLWLEFSHPVESLALTVEEMINVRRVLVKAEMEKFLQSKELYSSLRRGKVCCCCRAKFPLFSWPASCFFCKRSVCSSCSLKMKMPSKKLAHIPVYALGFESLPGSLLPKAVPLRRREPFQARSCATSAPTAPASSPTWSAPAAAAWPSSTPAPRPGATPRPAPSTATRGSSEGPGAPVMVATGVPVTPAQPPDVHIYIGWIHTASIFIYIMDQGAKGPVPAVPAIPFCPCHQPPRGWILSWGTHSPRWNGSCSSREDGCGCGQLLGDGSCCGTLRVPAFAPLLCQALAVPGCPVPWAGMAVLYVPSDNKPAGLPWGRVAGPEWMGERGEGCCGV
ncbi:protein spire homolog 2 isoform X3 [Corvus cornix cornix]|uniref:protein spire homolog 2 isoform X3 n=1 Tax=Corvus cornix cornix TaxID=932674 RepID=UPI001951DEA8|nr:protein spire homolog 2 isoform X3 [Corvus cornix cornix]